MVTNGRYQIRIKPNNISDCPWYLRLLLWFQRRKYGEVLNSSLVWARSPKLFIGLAVLYGGIDRKSSPIPPALRSLVTVRVSQLNGCAFCVDLNSYTLLKRGMSEAKLASLNEWNTSPLFDTLEKTVLAYTEAMTLSDQNVEDALMKRLQVLFKDNEIIELTALVAFQNMSAKFNSALDVPPQGFCVIGKD